MPSCLLSGGSEPCTSPEMSDPAPNSPQIFDPALRAMRRDRACANFARHDFLYAHMLDELFARLEVVQRPLADVLVIGCPDTSARDRLRALGKNVVCADPGFANARANDGVQADEDALPFADNSFDLILACGTLDSINDLPGALLLMRRVLRPDGLLLAAFTGAGSLPMLKSALLTAEGDRASAHVHPQIDLRAAGDLLQRAGFALPVVDSDRLDVRYSSLLSLMADLRGMGCGNILARRSAPLTRQTIARACEAFAAAAEPDGKTRETFQLVYLTAWKPDPSQPAPARRGSARVSLADALKSPNQPPEPSA